MDGRICGRTYKNIINKSGRSDEELMAGDDEKTSY